MGVWLLSSVGIGLGITACVVAQAVFLGDLVSRLFHHPLTFADVRSDLVGLVIASALRAALIFLSALVGAAAANRVRGRLRHDALGAILERGPAWLAGERSGELAVSVGRGLDALDTYVGDYLPRLVLAVLSPLVLLAVIGYLDWLSLVILLAALGVVPVFMVLIGRLTQERVGRRWAALGALGAHFLDAVQGLATLRAYGRAKRQEAQIDAVTDELRRTTLAVLREAFLSALVLETLAAVGTALVAVPLALRLIAGHMALAPAITILVLTPEVFLPLRRASADFHAASEGLSATERVFEVLDDEEPNPLREQRVRGAEWARRSSGVDLPNRHLGDRHPAERQGCGASITVPGSTASELVVSGLSISYPGRDRPAITGLDLSVAPGERVGIVGESGAGKSSLLGAIAGVVPTICGSITVGALAGIDADPERWRAQFAYLPQRPHLFSGTLGENLALGSASQAESDEDPERVEALSEALSVAQLTGLIARLPGGLYEELGEGGQRLSTGERQRVALARALARTHASVVVLDEPTAHLDATTESRLLGALDTWLGGRSLLFASHRPRLLELADRVVTLEHGRVAGEVRRVRLEPGLA